MGSLGLRLVSLALAVTMFLPVTVCAWSVLERFGGETLYAVYEVSYKVELQSAGKSCTALSTYELHVLVERLNKTHYVVSALAGNVTYSFTSDDVIFIHAVAPLYLANLSRYFVELLYIPPVKGVTVDVVLTKESVIPFLNSVTRWYKLVEDTSGEVCSEIAVGGLVIKSGVRYKTLSPRVDFVYDCPTGLLVSMVATMVDELVGDMRARATITVALAKLNFLNLTSIELVRPATGSGPPAVVPLSVLLIVASAILASVVILVVLLLRKLKRLTALRVS